MATRKIRKFKEGGVSADDLEAANASEDPIEALNARKGWTGGDDEAPIAPAAVARKQSFKEAFAEARRGGDKTFEWNGKKYTTEMSGQKPAATKAPARVTDTGDETARLAARRAAPAKPKYETAADRLYRRNREEAAAKAASTPRGQDRILRDVRPGAVNPNTLLPTGMKKGGVVSKASGRADGIAQRGKTRGKIY